MPVSEKKVAVSKFPLRLMPSVRRVAENYSQKEGVSLNQFINIAVAEKLAHLIFNMRNGWRIGPKQVLL